MWHLHVFAAHFLVHTHEYVPTSAINVSPPNVINQFALMPHFWLCSWALPFVSESSLTFAPLPDPGCHLNGNSPLPFTWIPLTPFIGCSFEELTWFYDYLETKLVNETEMEIIRSSMLFLNTCIDKSVGFGTFCMCPDFIWLYLFHR